MYYIFTLLVVGYSLCLCIMMDYKEEYNFWCASHEFNHSPNRDVATTSLVTTVDIHHLQV